MYNIPLTIHYKDGVKRKVKIDVGNIRLIMCVNSMKCLLNTVQN